MAAKNLGLIDGFGGIQRAIQSAAWKAKLKDYMVVEYQVMKSPFEMFFGDKNAQSLASAALQNELGEFYEPVKKLQHLKDLEGMQMLMPWEISIR